MSILRSLMVCVAIAALFQLPAASDTVSLPYLKDKQFDGRDLKLVKVLARTPQYTRYYTTYKSGDLSISGIMNVPEGKGPFPVVITCHGFINPKVYTNGRGLKREQEYLANRGFIVLHPDYRNHNGSDKVEADSLAMHLGYTEDVINAVLAVKGSSLASIDKENIGLLGHSMGGLIAFNMMVTKPGLVKAYVLFTPMSIDYRDNFERWILRRREQKYGSPSAAKMIIEKYGSPDSNPLFWNELSAKSFLNNVTEPVQLHHGTADESVPVGWSAKVEKAFKDSGKALETFYYAGEKHEFIKQWPLVMKRTAEFFRRSLK